MAAPDFWSDRERAQTDVEEVSRLRALVNPFQALEREIDDFSALQQLAAEETDATARAKVEQEVATEHERLLHKLEEFELRQFLSGENDRANAFLTIHSGAGGTESCDWADMLLRMYQRWIERSGFKSQTVDIQQGEEVGIKSVTLLVSGEYAYGHLQTERGVHRLVRISPFDANKRRHTSFASVDVVPEIADTAPIEIAWGNQIRSYVFQPYQMVKDHRTGAETSNVQDVMDGNIDMFIQAKLRGEEARKSENAE